MYDISSIDDFAAIISSALADTTVPSQLDERADSRDSWMDIDAWIAASVPDKTLPADLAEFLPASPPREHKPPPQSTLQSLLTHGYMPLLQSRLQPPPEAPSSTSAPDTPYGGGLLKDERLLYGAAHTTTHSPHPHKSKRRSKARAPPPALHFAPELGPLLGKEKPVHRCGICNRGFLNKSNIKVHLRTHTGEKPFRCDVCSKAFRQKAHLIKHQQIHKRIGRD